MLGGRNTKGDCVMSMPIMGSDMTRVEEKIRMVVEHMGNLTYVFENLQGANLRLDSAELPAFVNVIPLTGSIRVTPTQIRNYPKCSFWFVDKVNLDADGEDIQDVVNRCMDYAYEFILTLNESKFFEPVENMEVDFQVVTSDMDANVAGIVMEIQLRERNGLILCLDKKPKDYFNGSERRCEEGHLRGTE